MRRSVSLTGEIRARDQSDLSFRVGGRLTERNVDVGDHVIADQVLAKIDPAEQDANVSAALASVRAAEALLRQATATYERQKSLLDRGFTTRRDFEAAEEAWRTAQGSLDAAQAELAAAHEQRADTVLAAPVAGVVTARNAEVGQVVQAAEPVFSIAHDGARDAVFQVHEVVLSQSIPDPVVTIALLSDPSVTATGPGARGRPDRRPGQRHRAGQGRDREPAQGDDARLGRRRVGVAGAAPARRAALGRADRASRAARRSGSSIPRMSTVALRQIGVDSYDVGTIIVRDGLEPGETVVTAGAQLLRPEQRVALAEAAE